MSESDDIREFVKLAGKGRSRAHGLGPGYSTPPMGEHPQAKEGSPGARRFNFMREEFPNARYIWDPDARGPRYPNGLFHLYDPDHSSKHLDELSAYLELEKLIAKRYKQWEKKR